MLLIYIGVKRLLIVNADSILLPGTRMESLKKYLGIVWILLGVYVGYDRITDSIIKIGSDKLEDRVFGWVVLCVLVPIVVGGLILFGKYALDGEYSNE